MDGRDKQNKNKNKKLWGMRILEETDNAKNKGKLPYKL